MKSGGENMEKMRSSTEIQKFKKKKKKEPKWTSGAEKFDEGNENHNREHQKQTWSTEKSELKDKSFQTAQRRKGNEKE